MNLEMDNNRPIITKKLYIWTIVIIYITDTLMFATNSVRAFLYIKKFGVIFIAAAMVLYRNVKNREGIQPVVIFLSGSIMISAILAGRFTTGYSYYTMIACIWLAYLFSREYSIEQFSYCFCRVMRIIAIVSLIGWMFASVITSIGEIPVITNTVGIKYKNLFLTVVPVLSHHAKRNMGPFWEPGAYQVYLNVALYFTLFIEKHKKKVFDAVLFIITCLTTLSGAALVPMLLMIAAYTFEKKNLKGFVFTVFMFGIVMIMFATGAFDDITTKMAGEAETNSITYRWIGIEGGLRGFLHNPLFGSTPEYNEQIKRGLAIKYLRQTYASNTNTFINYLAYYGIFVGGFMLVRAFKLCRKSTKSALASFLCFAAFMVTTSNENMMDSLMIVVLMFLKTGSELQKGGETNEDS